MSVTDLRRVKHSFLVICVESSRKPPEIPLFKGDFGACPGLPYGKYCGDSCYRASQQQVYVSKKHRQSTKYCGDSRWGATQPKHKKIHL